MDHDHPMFIMTDPRFEDFERAVACAACFGQYMPGVPGLTITPHEVAERMGWPLMRAARALSEVERQMPGTHRLGEE